MRNSRPQPHCLRALHLFDLRTLAFWLLLPTLWILLSPRVSSAAQLELISNGAFSPGSASWVLSGNFFADSRFSTCRSCPGYAYVSNADGTPGNNLLGTMYQVVSIPSGATSATLSLWYNITSQESGSVPSDVLNVTIQNSTGDYLATVATLSNLHGGTLGSYSQIAFDVTAYKGQTIRVHFLATTNASLPTTFRVDDVSLTAVMPALLLPAPTLLNPSNGAVGVSTTPTFSWSAVTGANRYWLMVATNEAAFLSAVTLY